MNKIKLLLIFGLLFSLNTNSFSKGKFGFRGGYQAANLYSGSSTLGGTFNTFYVGAYKEAKLARILHFDFGVDYTQNGSFDNADNNIVLQYLMVPLDLKLKLGPFFALAGVAPSFKIGEQWTIQGSTTKPSNDLKSNSFDLPVFAGAGIKLGFIVIEARYYYGTLSVNNNSISGFEDHNNQYFQAGLGVMI